MPYLNAERDKPPFEGTINGITITVDDVTFDRKCDEFDYGDLDVADSTALRIHPTYIPDGGTIGGTTAYLPVVLCDGTPVSSQLSMTVASDPQAHRYGGTIRIYRYDNAMHFASASIPGYRWSAIEIAGRRAVVARPIFPETGVGGTFVAIADGSIMTTISSDTVPFEEVRKVAEGLF